MPSNTTNSSGAGLRPAQLRSASSGPSNTANRTSKVDLNFEEALAADKTFKLQESVDISKLGAEAQATPPRRALTAMAQVSSSSGLGSGVGTSSGGHGPGNSRLRNPVVIPPTPQNNPNLPSIATLMPQSYNPSTPIARRRSPSPGDIDPDDEEYQTKRRSLFRSPGTASSPDLATFLKKAKERGALSSGMNGNDELTVPGSSTGGAPSSAGSSYSLVNAPPMPPLPPMPKNQPVEGSATRPRTLSREGGKKTMRNKTSAFFGKMLGTGTTRDKQKMAETPSMPVASPIFSAFSVTTQPLPPLPLSSPPAPDSKSSLGDDDIVIIGKKYSSDSKPSHESSKPSHESNKRSVDSIPPQPGSPTTKPRHRDFISRMTSASSSNRRRSMSVGDVDWQKGMPNSPSSKTRGAIPGTPDKGAKSPMSPGPSPDSAHSYEWERAMANFSAFMDATGPLEIKDPSTPGRLGGLWKPSQNKSKTADEATNGSKTTTPTRPGAPTHSVSLPVTPVIGSDLPDARAKQQREESTPPISMTSAPSDTTIGSSRRPSTSDNYLSNATFDKNHSGFTSPGLYSPSVYGTPTSQYHSSPPGTPRGSMAALGNGTPSSSATRGPTSPNPRQTTHIPTVRIGSVPANGKGGKSGNLINKSTSLSASYPAPPRVHTSKSSPGPNSAGPSNAPSADILRLRMQSRSAASASEPSLLVPRGVYGESGEGPGDPQATITTNGRTIRLVPSGSSFGDASSFDEISSRGSPSSSTAYTIHRKESLSGAGLAEGSDELDRKGKEIAQRCWEEDESLLQREKYAEWLGGIGLMNKTALRYYVDFFDFSNLRLDNAFRRLCSKLYLKAETQQVDRILEEFARRYWDCNPSSLFGSASIVHFVAYSLLLLNTDLHVAELVSHMSRGQFVRNTMGGIQGQLHNPEAAGSSNPTLSSTSSSANVPSSTSSSTNPSSSSSSHPPSSAPTSITGPHPLSQIPSRRDSATDINSSVRGSMTDLTTLSSRRGSTVDLHSRGSASAIDLHDDLGGGNVSEGGDTVKSRSHRSGSVTSWRSFTKEGSPVAGTPSATTANKPLPMVYGRNWEMEMETLLKEIYHAVKQQQILQPLADRHSMSGLSPGFNTVGRRPSVRQQDRLATLKRGSIRGLTTLLTGPPPGASPYSSNSSIEGRISPSPSFATSIGDGFSTSASSYTPIGFASNLSKTIIREREEDDDQRSINSDKSGSTDVSIGDDELALLGAPWAKEGMLSRKQYWESHGKRAKAKSWIEMFVVIQKGELNMFTFGEHADTGASDRGGVGGGTWLKNANSMGKVMLAHSLAHVLPAPGYNRQRPYCFVLTLASGAVYFFQAGTEDLVNEWVSTCNYWAARQSKEPLSGGVSNMEYGWNRVTDGYEEDPDDHDDSPKPPEVDRSDTLSMRSTRSRLTKRHGPSDAMTMRLPSSPYVDRIVIHDWKPPMPPTVASQHEEEVQLDALQKQASSLKSDLKAHNDLRTPMVALFSPKSSNLSKATVNWERKSQHLLTEIVKYDSYVESLRAAMSLRLKRRGEKALEKALVAEAQEAAGATVKGKKWRFKGEDTILEGEEPQTPMAAHRRDAAQVDASE